MTMPKGLKTSEQRRREEVRRMDKLHSKAMALELPGAFMLIIGLIMTVAGMAIVISGNVGPTSNTLIIIGIILTTTGSLMMKRGKSVRDQVYYPPYK